MRTPPIPAAAGWTGLATGVAVAAATSLPILLLAFGDGYFAQAWGWATLSLLAIAAMAAAAGARSISRGAAAAAGVWAAYLVLAALSATVSGNVGRALLEVERGLIYLAGIATAALLARGHRTAVVVGAVVACVAAAANGLSFRLFPTQALFDPVATYRLAEPLGYTNAVGALAVLGLLLVVGLTDGRRRGLAIAAAPAAPLLATTLYFTYSRGSWVALAVGLATFASVRREKLCALATIVVTGAPAAAAVALAAAEPALSRTDADLASAGDAGARLAYRLALVGVAAVAIAAARAWADDRVRLPPRARLALGTGVAVALALALVAAARWAGSPAQAWRSFSAVPAAAPGADLNERLFTLSGSGRVDFWRAALQLVERHPLTGSGAGTYELWWNAERTTNFKIRDAHSAYLEALAELGPAGVALLLALVAVPLLVGGRAARGDGAVAGAFAAWVAFAAHAGVDWDLELPALALAGFTTAGVLVAPGAALAPRSARALPAVGLAVAVLATVGLIGENAVAASSRAAARGDWAVAAAEARRAARWLPWSAPARRALAQAQLGGGEEAAARRTYRRAIELDPENWELWLDLARASHGRERARALARAARLNPLSPEVQAFRNDVAATVGP